MKYPAKQIFEGNRGNMARLHAKGARGRKERKIPLHSRTLHVIVVDKMIKNNRSLTTTTLFEASNTWTVGSL